MNLFNRFIHDCNLIDRFLISSPCIDKFKRDIVKRLPRPTSNLCPMHLTLGEQNWGLSYFKYKNMWMDQVGGPSILLFYAHWWLIALVNAHKGVEL